MDAIFEMLVGMGELTLIMMGSALVVGLGYVIKQSFFRKK